MFTSESQFVNLFDFLQKHIVWSSYQQIIEFGGGFGCMCKMIFDRGFSGTYYIFDFPELSQLQKYYLCKLGENVKFINNFDKLPKIQSDSLFISVSALEESPKEIREKMLEYAKDCRDFFFKFSAGGNLFTDFSNEVGGNWIKKNKFTSRTHVMIGKTIKDLK
jgi:hypothetical protein